MSDLIVIGTGGLAREVTDWISSTHKIIGYSSITAEEHSAFGLPGQLFGVNIVPSDVGTDQALVAIGDPGVRRRVYAKLQAAGFSLPSFVHPSASVSRKAILGPGVIVGAQSAVSPNVEIGLLAHVNFCVGIGHDAHIGDFVQLNPGVQVGGGAQIGDGTTIGSGATVLHGTKIGENAIVASGAVVFSRVPAGATMMGNPAKRLRIFDK